MSLADQDAVRAVVRDSSLVHYWPDLTDCHENRRPAPGVPGSNAPDWMPAKFPRLI